MGLVRRSPVGIPCSQEIAFNFFGPLGLPISPDLPCWWALEAHVYIGVPTALILRQTRQAVDFGEGKAFAMFFK